MEATEKSAATFLWNDGKLTTATFETLVAFLMLNKQSRGKSLSGVGRPWDITVSCPAGKGMSSLQPRHHAGLPSAPEGLRFQSHLGKEGAGTAGHGVLSSWPPELLRDDSPCVAAGERTGREQENLPSCLMECE